MVSKGRAEASLWGFFNGPNFLLQEVPSWKWYRRAEVLFFSFFFFQNCALGKLQKLNRKYEIWKFKKGTKSLQSGQKVTDMEKQRILAHLSFVPNLI